MTRPLDTRVGSPGRVLPGSGVLDPGGAALIDRLHTIAQTCDLVARMQGLSAARKLWLDLGGPVLPLDGEATDAAGRPAALRTLMPDQGRSAGAVSFDFDGRPVRTVLVDDMVWFVGQDVAERLGYVDGTNALKQHCRGVVKRHPIIDNLGRPQEVRLINEPDVLRLIMKSKLPAAERFERWVFEVVLPEVRRTGQFAGGVGGVRGRPKLRTSPEKQAESGFAAPVKEWIAQFLHECCEIDAQSEIRAFDFREAFRQWAISEGAPVPIPSAFGRYVINLGVRKRKSGGNIYVGLRLKPAFDPKRRLL